MARSWISAQVKSPVRPSPPMVARCSSGFSVGEQTRRLPSERSSSEDTHVSTEGASMVVVLAVHVVGDASS